MNIKKRARRFLLLVAALVLAFGFAQPATAELAAYDQDLQLVFDVVDGEAVLSAEGDFAFPLWYMDAKFLMLQACLDNPDMCLQEFDLDAGGDEVVNGLFEHEFIYWVAEAAPNGFTADPTADDGAQARFILALEGFIEELAPPEGEGLVHGVFNAVIIRMRGLQPNAQFTIIHPFSPTPVLATSDNRGRLLYEAPELHPEGTAQELFDIALEGPIQHFLYSDTLLPIEVEGNYYIGDPTIIDPVTQEEEGHTIFGSPYGINYVRVTGPGLPEEGVFANKFVVAGQIFFNEGQNLAPIANFDVAATKLAVPVIIDVLDNDLMQGDVPINPTSLEKQTAISNLVGGTVATERDLDKVLLQFTPTAAGAVGFDYTVQSFTGMSDTASVTVLVENLLFNQAEYRARTGKWALNGTSNFRGLVVESETSTIYLTGLFGAQEVPPVTSSGSGETMITVRIDDILGPVIDYSLTYEGLVGVTQAHIHNGGVGVNGPFNVFLCTNLALPGNFPDQAQTPPACPTQAGTVTGTLTANDFISAGAVTTFVELLQAIDDGNTYVNVHTAAFSPGEIRGQIGRNVISLLAGENGPAIGAAEVQAGAGPNLTWSYSGKSIGSPGAAPHMIHAESALGNLETRELQLR